MALFLAPICNDQTFDANGDPLVGGQIETYIAGSSTPAATYIDDAGGTPQSNPIILNSLGYPTLGPIWLTGGIPYKFIIKNAAGSTLRTIDYISGINDASVSQSEWVESGFSPTYISGTSFSVPGDQTPTLQVNRRVRTTNTSGFVYSTISNSVFAAGITTVTLVNDSTTLDAGLSLVAYALLAANPLSVPILPINSGTAVTLTNQTTVDFTSIPSWVNRITVVASDISTNGTTAYLIQLGDSGGFETSGYSGSAGSVLFSTGFIFANPGLASAVSHAVVTITRVTGNTWMEQGGLAQSTTAAQALTAGSKTLSATLDRLRITTANGTDQFDAGVINILWE